MCKVLIVEDEEIERMALSRILQDNLSNIEIIGEAGNGYEAIDIIKRKKMDLVFVDINIPGINGLEVIKYIKSKYPKIIVIVLTAYDKFEFAHTALKLKVDDYLLKPVKPSLIIETLERYFNNTEENYNLSFCQSYIYVLKEEIIKQSYYNSIKAVREFIFSTYEKHDINSISKMIVEFGNGIISICEELKMTNVNKIAINLNNTRNKRIQLFSKYDMYNEFVEIINMVFDDIMLGSNRKDNSELDFKRVLNYIDRNIKNGITLEDVADYINMSIYYLSKVFKKEMNMNFINYITNRKMEIAKEILINTNDPIINIAIELSYTEANYFSKVFKKQVGMTPTEYREKHKKAELKSSAI